MFCHCFYKVTVLKFTVTIFVFLTSELFLARGFLTYASKIKYVTKLLATFINTTVSQIFNN
jgi:hypothetical protein